MTKSGSHGVAESAEAEHWVVIASARDLRVSVRGKNSPLLDTRIDRDTVKRMETVTISPKFQVVIPRKVRESMGLRSGEKAKVLSFRDRIEILPLREVRKLRGYLKGIDTSFVRDGDRV